MPYTLPQLPYSYDALEPSIDEPTMRIHHTKHHQAYLDKLNAVMEKHPALGQKPIEELLLSLKQLDLPEADRTALRNHGGGHANHSLFWQIMGPAKDVDETLHDDVKKEFGSLKEFRKAFAEKATAHFGSGWAWLVKDQAGKLHLYSLPNQDSPLLTGHTPIIGLDLWEHAYYLKYQNRRAEYIGAWWAVLILLP